MQRPSTRRRRTFQTPRGLTSSSATRIRSRIETMPHGVPPSSTGRWRNPPWIITTPACCVLSSASTVSGPRVIQSATCPPTSPEAHARITSRSVRIPISRPPETTRAAPTRRAVIAAAASTSVASCSIVKRFRDITSPTVVMSVSELRAPTVDVRLELVLQSLVDLRLDVLLERLLRDLRRARGGIPAAEAIPALVVLGRGEERPVEALTEALERVHRTEE